MKKEYIIGICSVGNRYHERTKNLIQQIQDIIDVNFLIVTDNLEYFADNKNIILVEYEYKKASFHSQLFSFHDKRLVFQEGFRYADAVLLLDSDHCVREQNKNFLAKFNSQEISNGAYPQIIWKYPSDCSMEHFLEGKTSRVPYGKEFKQYCESKNYNINGAQLIQESFLFVKESPEKISKFLSTWEDLQKFCEQKDIEREQHILGYGEGYSIGVSLTHSAIKVIEGNTMMNSLFGAFKHLAWER